MSESAQTAGTPTTDTEQTLFSGGPGAAQADLTQPQGTQAEGTPTESFVNPDGTFKDGWHNQHVSEDHRKDTSWLGLKSIADLTGRISHLQGKLTQAGKGIFPINDKSTPEQVKEFRAAMNIPEKPDGYEFIAPKELAHYYQDQELMDEAREVLHGVNLNKAQFAAVMALDAMRIKKSGEEFEKDPLPIYEEILPKVMPLLKEKTEAELKTKWGDAFESRLRLANLAIAENVKDEGEKTKLLERIGNDPLIADFLATVQLKHHTESHGVDTSLGEGFKSQNIDQQIDTLMRNPHYLDGNTNPVEHDRLIKEVQRLHSLKTGGKMLE